MERERLRPLSVPPGIVFKVSEWHSGRVSERKLIRTAHSTGRSVTRLTYEAYTVLCMKSFEKIARSARDLPTQSTTSHTILSASPAGGDRLSKVAIHHRLGECPVGETSIVIAVSSPHRREAFEACEFILEEVKKKSQIWKREWYAEEGSDLNDAASWKENFPRIAKDGA